MRLLALLVGLAMITIPLNAQTSTRVAPDCFQTFSFPSTGVSADLNNIPQTASGTSTGGCSAWIISVEGFNSASGSVTFQQAPSNAAGTAPGTYITFVPLSGTTSLGSNPVTSFPGSFITTGYAPWLRVSVAVSAGTIRGTIQGWRSLSAARSGGGGGGATPGGSVNDVQWKLDSTTFGGGRCTMDSSQNVVCAGSYTAGSGSGTTGKLLLTGSTSAATSTLTVDDTNTATSIKLPNDATSGLRLATTPSAAPSSGCAQWNGTSTELTSTGSPCGGASSGGAISTYSAPAVTLPAAGTTFFPPGGGGLPSGTEANVQGASPVATISNFYVQLSANIGGGNSVAFTFRKAGADQAVTCTISGTNNSCNDTTHSFSVAAGDLLSIKAITSGTVIIAPTVVILYSTGGGGGGGGGTTVHHQFFTGATHPGTCPSGAADVSATINGVGPTNLCGAGNNQLGVMGPYAANTVGMIYVFLPPTWTGALTITLESSTSTNATGNFSFTPAFSCVASAKDLVAAPTYTSGSTVTVAAPGGSGSGFYRVAITLSITPTCTAGQGVQLSFTRGGSDTYSDSIYLMGGDLAMTY